MSRLDNSAGNDFNKSLCDCFVLVLQEVWNLSCFNLKDTHLDLLDYLFLDLNFPIQVKSNLISDLLNLFSLVLFNIFEVFIDIHQQKVLINIVFA